MIWFLTLPLGTAHKGPSYVLSWGPAVLSGVNARALTEGQNRADGVEAGRAQKLVPSITI